PGREKGGALSLSGRRAAPGEPGNVVGRLALARGLLTGLGLLDLRAGPGQDQQVAPRKHVRGHADVHLLRTGRPRAELEGPGMPPTFAKRPDRKSTRLNSSH